MPVARSALDVYLLLERNGSLLLALRDGTGYCDGMWNTPCGKVEEGEDAAAALVREANEEVGVELTADDLHLSGVVHCLTPENVSRVCLLFATTHDPARHGAPYNAEPAKCSGLAWYQPNALPPNTQPITAAGIHLYANGASYAALGWDGAPPW